MTAPLFSSIRISATTVEPLLWCGCLGIAMFHSALYDPSTDDGSPPPKEAILSLFLMGVITCRACFLVAKPRQSKNVPWRLPSSGNKPSPHGSQDAGGLFMSLLLMPLLCWAIGNNTMQQDSTATSIWYYYALIICVLSFVAWEDALWRQQRFSSMGQGKLLFAMVLGIMTVQLLWMAHANGYATTTFVLVTLWQVLYHSMQHFLPQSFHGVFTQGEWMVVTSLIAIGLTHYHFLYWTNEYLSEQAMHQVQRAKNNHATVAFSGLIAAAVTCPIMTALNNRWMMQRQNSKPKKQSNHKALVALLMQLPLWIGIPLGGVELLEFHWTGIWSKEALLEGQQQSSPLKILMEKWNLPTGCIPKSIQWLVQFLAETEQPLVTTLRQMPRFGWLLYWMLVLAIAIPFAPEPPHNDNSSSNTQAIVVARKWFHGVAVVLFGPVTLAAPQLLSLAYAIALAILMLLESARTAFPMIQQFHQQYLDPSKDAAHGLVISHMALIVGCALPLWISELVYDHNRHGSPLPPETLVLLQLWGVLTLGVGDAMGAIVGVRWGRNQWSRYNSRTLEGSLAMWMSLLASCWFVYWYCGGGNLVQFSWHSFVAVTVVTLLEAHTSQIDNLVLPLVGATLLLLLAP